VKGDARSVSIAAASIVAKVAREAAELPLNTILDGDCIEAMNGLPEAPST
jgi:ribonuclease HII